MTHDSEIRRSFTAQAEKMAAYHMSKAAYTDYLIRRIQPTGCEHALDAAAGTCICARALAPHVQDCVCLDLTEAMLDEGCKLADQAGLRNLTFVPGNAEDMPFPDGAFDLVVTRLSFHHFADPARPFAEMRRVLKPGGKLVVWDMEAADEPLRAVNDRIEALRDPSHTRILSRSEFEALFAADFDLRLAETTLIPVRLQSWMDLTATPPDVQRAIVALMEADLSGGAPTGFSPYRKDGEIFFDHRWRLMIGVKR